MIHMVNDVSFRSWMCVRLVFCFPLFSARCFDTSSVSQLGPGFVGGE